MEFYFVTFRSNSNPLKLASKNVKNFQIVAKKIKISILLYSILILIVNFFDSSNLFIILYFLSQIIYTHAA